DDRGHGRGSAEEADASSADAGWRWNGRNGLLTPFTDKKRRRARRKPRPSTLQRPTRKRLPRPSAALAASLKVPKHSPTGTGLNQGGGFLVQGRCAAGAEVQGATRTDGPGLHGG